MDATTHEVSHVDVEVDPRAATNGRALGRELERIMRTLREARDLALAGRPHPRLPAPVTNFLASHEDFETQVLVAPGRVALRIRTKGRDGHGA